VGGGWGWFFFLLRGGGGGRGGGAPRPRAERGREHPEMLALEQFIAPLLCGADGAARRTYRVFASLASRGAMLLSAVQKIFLLSPAHSGGKRAQLILNPRAGFPLARRLHRAESVALGEIFTFLSGLYFRGKLAYAAAFATPPSGMAGAYVITSNRGLLPANRPISLADLKSFSRVDIDAEDARYRRPLLRDAKRIAAEHPECRVVLLGSISTGKYTDILLGAFRERLHFPVEFIGRGDMSRGGLMLRCARTMTELEYATVAGAVRHGKRPPKLEPLRRAA
jgi:hypothetical protein